MTESTTGPAVDELVDESEAEPETPFLAGPVPSTTGPQPPDSASEPTVLEAEVGRLAPGEAIPSTNGPQPPDVTSDADPGGHAGLGVASAPAPVAPAPQPFNDPMVDPESAAELESEVQD